jgi:hypothetical protein
VNELGSFQRELEGDHATEGMPDDVCAPHAEMRQQGTTVVGLIRKTDSPYKRAAADIAATVVADQSVPIRSAELGQQRAATFSCARAQDLTLRCIEGRARPIAYTRGLTGDRRTSKWPPFILLADRDPLSGMGRRGQPASHRRRNHSPVGRIQSDRYVVSVR